MKSDAQITQEIQAIIRQITASVTFLPLLEDVCTIDLLAYTDKESEIPIEWCVRLVWPFTPRIATALPAPQYAAHCTILLTWPACCPGRRATHDTSPTLRM